MNCDQCDAESTATAGVTSGSDLQEQIAGIYRLIYAKVGNKDAAEELTSQVFLQAARRRVDPRDSELSRHALTALARAAITAYWRDQGTFQVEQDGDLLWCGGNGDEEAAATRTRARRLLDALPEQERTIVRMRLLQGCSAAEVGRRLSIEPRLVQTVQLRALRRAAAMLGAS